MKRYVWEQSRIGRLPNGRIKLRISGEEGANMRWWRPILLLWTRPLSFYVCFGGRIRDYWYFFRFHAPQGCLRGGGHIRISVGE